MIITIVYDNVGHEPDFKTAWGYACLVERNGTKVLFDTGGVGRILLANMRRLGIDIKRIDAVTLSHPHWDHTGGLKALLEAGAQPTVFVPQSFPAAFKEESAKRATIEEVVGACSIVPGVHTTGEVVSAITEQALVVETEEGPIVITGCAHPGIVEMVKRARQVVRGDVRLVMGGFHLKDASRERIEEIADELRNLGVQSVAPSHCTGENARECFRAAFDGQYHAVGVGWSFGVASRHVTGEEELDD